MTMSGVLSGVRILDLTHAYAGPFCTYNLALLGADIIKVEPPQGDDFRPRSEVFGSINAGKRSIVLDLKDAEGQRTALQLAESCDVLVENFRPGVTERLGVDFESVKMRNDKLIYCSISGYGNGPLSQRPAIEWSVQAAAGMTNEYMQDYNNNEWFPGLSIVDPLAGYVAFSAILAALLEREQTGSGQRLDISMLDASLSLMSQYVAASHNGEAPKTFTLGGRLKTLDRPLYVALSHQRWFEQICAAVGADALLDDPRFATQTLREANHEAFWQELEEYLGKNSAEYWEEELTRRGVPAAVIRSFAEMPHVRHVQQRGLFRETTTTANKSGVSSAGAFQLASQDRSNEPLAIPYLGQHTAEVLAELMSTAAQTGKGA